MAIMKQLALTLAILVSGVVGGRIFDCNPANIPNTPNDCSPTSIYMCQSLCPAGYNCGTDYKTCRNNADGYTCYCDGQA
ncbi:hypothetical protein Tdes44962_MAKER07585 [Teratosphaeria destructans]|uniref:Uncharacterized protein n=1 Tax=Teratosphaeria destructans TaxID=418781 RepID=A0A9W7W625_9PEZI|nr:hypothetical protein Tdes44962_MAKER07585 [Teratosphaeria destructans]